MSATTSATTGRHYGLQRVCRAWERSRSALYARRTQAERRRPGDGPARRRRPAPRHRAREWSVGGAATIGRRCPPSLPHADSTYSGRRSASAGPSGRWRCR